MNVKSDHSRRDAILNAALETFSSYGFRRTSMDDIAKAAGVSRPGLYQTFANKQEIYRGLITAHTSQISSELRALLEQELPLKDLLVAMLTKAVVEPHRMVEATPHGAELLGMKTEMAEDLFLDWEAQVRNHFVQVFEKRSSLRAKDAEQLAHTISLAISGMKSRSLTSDQIEQELDGLVSVVSVAARSLEQT